MILSLLVGIGLHHAQASTTKFIFEGNYTVDSTHFGAFFVPDVAGVALSDFPVSFSTAGIVTEDDVRTAEINALVTYVNGAGGYSGITAADVLMPSKPIMATVGTTGLFSDLLSKPTTLAGYGITDGATAYEGTTARSGAFPIFKSATVSGGTAIFYLTNDGTSTGTALFPNGVITDSVNATVSDATASYQMSWAFSNSNKTLTVTTNKLTTANILTGILGQSAANSSVVKLSVWGY